VRRLAGVLALLVLALAPAIAHADFGIVPGSFQSENLDAGGQPDLRAGAHPDRLVSSFALNLDQDGNADGNAKDVIVEMPTGFAGNARGIPTCPRPVFATGTCPPESKIGEIVASFIGFGTFTLPIFNIAPQEGEAAEFGFVAFVVPVRMIATVDPQRAYDTTIELHDLSQSVPLSAAEITLWGVPADHQLGATGPRRALLTNPTRCDRVPVTGLRVRSWQHPETWVSAEVPASGPLTGCDALPFHPSVDLALDTPAADSPSGVRVDVGLQQSDAAEDRGSSQVRDLSIQLPPGVTLSPGVASGLAACDDTQLGLGSPDAPTCPDASKIGSAELTSPLTGPLPGALYLGRPLPGDPYRLFMTADGPGFFVKLRGSLRPDPDTGQLTASFADLPELTFSALSLHFKDGPRAPLATPATCGVASGSARLTPYSTGTPVSLPVSVTVGGGGPCPSSLPFAPQLVAGATPPTSGDGSAFSMTLRRPNGDQTLGRLALTLPPGLTARLADVAPCADAAAAAGSCPPGSRIGTVAAEVGAGTHPLPLSGDAYVTGPYRGAPFGLALVIRAQAGPLDLGTLVVRGTLRLDPLDGSLTIATPLPRLLAGIPLRLQTIALDVDRPGFMLNPTRCAPGQIAAAIGSADATTSHRSLRFAVGGCRRLGFRPDVSLALGPAAQLREGGHPELRIGLRTRAGQTNLRSATIRLPRMLTLNQTAVTAICSRAQAIDGRCPRASRVGTARARTPLLSQLLRGPVNVVQPLGGGQPDLWATLAGQGVRIALRSTIALPRGKPMTTRFVGLPDLPLSRFALTLDGGAHGPLAAVAGFCRGGRPQPLAVDATLRAQNGRERSTRVRIHAHPSCAR
jgi:hypothetical protein